MKALASFRRGMELFANIRPAKVYPQLIQASPLKDTVARELDLIVLRENTAGIFYAGKYRKETGGELTPAMSASTPGHRSSGTPDARLTWPWAAKSTSRW